MRGKNTLATNKGAVTQKKVQKRGVHEQHPQKILAQEQRMPDAAGVAESFILQKKKARTPKRSGGNGKKPQ